MEFSSGFYKTLSTVACVISLISFFLIIGMYLYPMRVISVFQPIEVPTIVVPGEDISYYVKYEKYYPAPEEIAQQLEVQGLNICSHTQLSTNLPIGDGKVRLELPVPKNIEPGQGRIKIIIKYVLHGGMRTVTKTYETEKFYVEKKGSKNE
jgi:hypothetical protein